MKVLFSIFFCACGLIPLHGEERPLQATGLTVRGPSVIVNAPLGLGYHPGYLFPLQLRVRNDGAEFTAEVSIESEGGTRVWSDAGPQAVFPTADWRQLTFPVRLPAISADLTVFIREVLPGSSVRPVRFQASLAHVLKPLPAEERVTVSCGNRAALLHTFGEVAQLTPGQMPDEDWMYDSVDLAVLPDESFAQASPAAKEALRLWVLGGGKLLLATAEGPALQAAIAARLLPLELSPGEEIEARISWWQDHVGAGAVRVLEPRDQTRRAVFLGLRMGLGEVVCVMPGTPSETVSETGRYALANLRKDRPALPDFQVQPERFKAFTFGAVNPALRGRAILWAGLGALVLGLVLILCFSARSRWEALGWPVAACALLALLLAHWFPAPQALLSRVCFIQHSADGRAAQRSEWVLAEAFGAPVTLNAAGPANELLSPIYSEKSELNEAAGAVLYSHAQVRLEGLPLTPEQPRLLFSGKTIGNPPAPSPAHTLRARSGKIELTMSGMFPPLSGFTQALWVKTSRKVALLNNFASADGFIEADYEGTVDLLRRQLGAGSPDSLVRARAEALNWAVQAAQRARRDTLIFWTLADHDPPLALFTAQTEAHGAGRALEEGAAFAIHSVEVQAATH